MTWWMEAGLFRADPQIGASELRSASPKGGPVPKQGSVGSSPCCIMLPCFFGWLLTAVVIEIIGQTLQVFLGLIGDAM